MNATIEIPFHKLHGAENDFLLTWQHDAPVRADLPDVARRICARNTGIGADGWMLVSAEAGKLHTRLFNSDGSEPEISGNGTRCAAAFGILTGALSGLDITVGTAAGDKRLRLLHRDGSSFQFEMEMGVPRDVDLFSSIDIQDRLWDVATLNVGNPQCVFFADWTAEPWIETAALAEKHPRFPHRTNVSFVRILDRHTIEAVFYERGAGLTRSSGTGATGAAVAAILRSVTESPVEIRTPSGSLHLRWDTSVYLSGPAESIGAGSYFSRP